MNYKLWDKENKEFLEDDWETEFAVLANGTVIEIYYNGFAEDYSVRNLDNIELLQYTGLKDKNGKEIYEGDIVLIRIEETSILHKTVVKFKHGAFIADIIGKNDYIYLFHFGFNKDDFEVLGNIYENSELLEDKDG